MIVKTEYSNFKNSSALMDDNWCKSIILFNVCGDICLHKVWWSMRGDLPRHEATGVWHVKYK